MATGPATDVTLCLLGLGTVSSIYQTSIYQTSIYQTTVIEITSV
ncbi:hypothetical protein [Streptomyces ziwulingensis]